MNINKAIRKQQKSYKRFMLIMCFVFFIIPAILIYTKKLSLFYIVYAGIIQFLIIISMLVKKHNEHIKFKIIENYRLYIELGLFKKKINILCDNIEIVHAESFKRKSDGKEDFKIIMITSSKFKSEYVVPVNSKLFKLHPFIAHRYKKRKMLYPEKSYFFTVIKKGKLYKYVLLDMIYRRCVNAEFTYEAIDRIKEYRESL
ncbi:hypothetical protein [Clostridium sp. HMP27]|uniref:hypothetical protein n=1 Tax=Clostridium sp. HMP27 TaxID=1487921 RepID=UPI00052BDDA1|nr:hypothetical protein [Clostridium sp. HMP27]KGK90697.1 membrane protein [Clostridium sp. HMP27]